MHYTFCIHHYALCILNTALCVTACRVLKSPGPPMISRSPSMCCSSYLFAFRMTSKSTQVQRRRMMRVVALLFKPNQCFCCNSKKVEICKCANCVLNHNFEGLTAVHENVANSSTVRHNSAMHCMSKMDGFLPRAKMMALLCSNK